MIPHVPAIDNRKMQKFILILSILFVAGPAWAAPFDDFKFHTGQRWDFGLESNFYKSDGNFDRSGNTFTRHASGYSYQNFGLDLNVRTGLGPKWNIYGGTRFATAQSKSLSTGSPTSKSTAGLSHIQVGTDTQLYAGSMLIFSDLSLSFPMAATERSAGANVAFTEGVTEIEGKVIFRVERKSFRFGGFGGLNFRDKGRSALVPYGLLAEISFGQWAFGTDLRGHQALTLDKDTDNEFAIEQAYFCPVNGCAKQYAAFNPSILQNNLWVRTNFNRSLGMHAGLSHDILGSNVSKGLNFYVGMIYRMKSQKTSDPAAFQEVMNDGIDQRPFENTSVTQPPKPVKPSRPKPNLKDELNKTEQLMESVSDPVESSEEAEE